MNIQIISYPICTVQINLNLEVAGIFKAAR